MHLAQNQELVIVHEENDPDPASGITAERPIDSFDFTGFFVGAAGIAAILGDSFLSGVFAVIVGIIVGLVFGVLASPSLDHPAGERNDRPSATVRLADAAGR